MESFINHHISNYLSSQIQKRVNRLKRILHIGHTDLVLFLKQRNYYVSLFLMPLMFIYFIGLATQNIADPEHKMPSLAVLNQDNGFIGQLFINELQDQNLHIIKSDSRSTSVCVVRIPRDFTTNIVNGQHASVKLVRGGAVNEADVTLIEFRLQRALVATNGKLIQSSSSPDGINTFTKDELSAIASRPGPVEIDATFAGRTPIPAGFNFSLPGILIMYLTMNLLHLGGANVATERRNGVLRRLMTYPVSHTDIVMGKIYGLMLLGVIQILFFVVVGKEFFHVNLGANIPAVTLVLLVLAWVAGSLGVLLGSVIPMADAVTGVAILTSLIMAALGGCWWPLEISPPALKAAAFCLPTGWALEALNQLISFGGGFRDIFVPLVVLILFGIGFNVLAVRCFRR